MYKKISFFFIFSFCMVGSSMAYGSYVLPIKPIAVSKLTKPYCIKWHNDISSCDAWEIESYNRHITPYNEYVVHMQKYISVLRCKYSQAVNELENG